MQRRALYYPEEYKENIKYDLFRNFCIFLFVVYPFVNFTFECKIKGGITKKVITSYL